MAMTGYNSKLFYGNTGTTGTNITNEVTPMNMMPMPGISVDDVEVTNYQSPSSYKEFLAGLKDGGELEFEVQYAETIYNTIFGLIGVVKAYRIVMPDGTYFHSEAYINNVGGSNPKGDMSTFTFKVKLTGVPTLTVA